MGILVTTLSLLGFCFFIRRFIRWPIEATPFFVISMIVVVCYLLAYQHLLQLGSILLIALGGSLFITSPLYLPKQASVLCKDYFTPGLLIYFFYIISFGYLAQHYAFFNDPDDFYRWIPHAKLMHFHHGFLSQYDIALNRDYPPGGSLLHYYFLRLSQFSLGGVYYSQLFFLFSPIVILLRKFQWSNWYDAFILSIAFIGLSIFYYEVPLGVEGTALMDYPVGITFGGIVASYFLMSKERLLWLYLMLPLVALMVFRPVLYPFIVLIGTVIFCDQYLLRKQQNKQDLIAYKAIIIALIIIPFLFWKSWAHYMNRFNISWSLGILIDSVVHKTFHLETSKFPHVISLFLNSTIKEVGYAILMLVLVAILTWRMHDKQLKLRIWCMQILLFFGFFGFLTMLLIFYLFQMPTGMALIISSYTRFANTYAMGWLIILLATATQFSWPRLAKYSQQAFSLAKHITGVLLVIYLYQFNINKYNEINHYIKAEMGLHYNDISFSNAAKPIINKLKPDAKVGIISDEVITMTAALLPVSPHIIIPTDTSNVLVEQIKKFDYLIIFTDDKLNNLKKYLASNNKPISSVTLCQQPGENQCQLEQKKYVYLYKTDVKNNQLNLENIG